ERLLDYLDEMFALHPSPAKINKGTLTPSSRRRSCRHHRHLLSLCRRLRLPPRLLPRLALGERGHRQLPTDQKGLETGILYVFCSCPNGTPRTCTPSGRTRKRTLAEDSHARTLHNLRLHALSRGPFRRTHSAGISSAPPIR